MSSTFGDQPGDVVTSSRGDVLEGVSLSLYPTRVDAVAQTNLLGTVVTDLLGRWSYTHATLTVVWVRTLDGQVYAVEDPTVTAAGAQAAAAAAAASAALSASLVGAPADTAVAAVVGNPASATSTSLSSIYTPRANVGTRAPNITNPLLGGTDMLIGGNVIPTPAQSAAAAGWYGFWQGIVNGDGTFAWVTAQIDALRGPSTKGNAIRIIGCNGGIRQGFYTRAQYIAAWQQVSDYCHSVGVLLYPALSGQWKDFGAGCAVAAWPTTADQDDLAAVALALQQMGNVVAFDVVQEYMGGFPAGGTVTDARTNLSAAMTAIRANGVVLPLTGSIAVHTADWIISSAENFVDFIDRHIYYYSAAPGSVPAPTEVSQLYSVIGTTMPVIFGEVGIPVSATGAQRTAYFEAIHNLLRGGRVVGAFAWAIGDQDTVSTNQWGLYSGAPGATLAARTDVCPSFLSWPRRKQATGIKKYAAADQALSAGYNSVINLTGTTFDCGGLGAGTSGVQATIPVGMGGLYRVTLAVYITIGATTSGVSITLVDGSAVSLLEVLVPTPLRVAGAISACASTAVLDLPDGTTLKPTIYTSQAITISGVDTHTFLSIEKVPATAF